jgi:poly-gamma-glutamate synthesis protein (capsule biosynthesis protein)
MKLVLAGDTMLGRSVAERIERSTTPVEVADLFDDGVVSAVREGDAFVLNLECAISDRGARWPDPSKPFFFRAPPVAAQLLAELGVDCVTLANNHAMDYGAIALLDTVAHLDAAGIAHAGAGATEEEARMPAAIAPAGTSVAVVSVTDHPAAYAAGPDRPGVAYADLRHEHPQWLLDTVAGVDADVVLVSPHWGPNMVGEPVRHVRAAARALVDAGATLVAGHSAHVFHGVEPPVLFDLGDFIDDYATDPRWRNDLGLLFLVTLEQGRPIRVEALPLALDFCFTRLANRTEADWIARRFVAACGQLGTDVERDGDRLVVELAAAT